MPTLEPEPIAKEAKLADASPVGVTTSESSASSSCTDREDASSSEVEDLDAEIRNLPWLRQTAAGKLHVADRRGAFVRPERRKERAVRALLEAHARGDAQGNRGGA